MSRRFDVAVVGAGPAGLAVAIGAAQRGLAVVVLERHAALPDKACGEGVMPPGLAALDALGVRALIPDAAQGPIDGIRYLQEDGTIAEGRLPGAGGRAIRRTALIEALGARARAVGVELELRRGVRAHARSRAGVLLETDQGPVEAALLVAADGLASPIRAREGLDLGLPVRRRFGLRQHFARAPWSRCVEVHLSEGCEAYVTPTRADEVGVAMLWEDGALGGAPELPALLARFPRLAEALDGAAPTSEVRGAGPLARRARAVIGDRLALVGDAAGYVDAITGEGLSVSLVAAEALVACLPAALSAEGDARALAPYARRFEQLFRRYRWSTEALLALARRPRLRRRVIRLLARSPRLFERVLASVVA